ncbi:helix-turn-helix domain-containing protein [Salinisphaera sp. G21_0]|uniref:helix-turn-helix domain-containing protein n=1 Tax=Salinisphaera sp. G21_0 TaxID=2821094 RepID=UPI001AD9886F|nr:helix-turn-helix domain-containing protein [Salinisphaera sp. G21_0]MBO9483077.1 helix-turn-helix domain-containing protein [Salinisphaera sp. G21_0]
MDKDAYLMELSRYVVLNPVRAKMVKSPDEWPWSSYCYTTGLFDSPSWLATDATLLYFGSDRDEAIVSFARFVAEGVGVNIWEHLKQQFYLGDDNFINKQLAYKPKGKAVLSEVPHKQRRKTAPPLSHFLEAASYRDEAIISAYHSGGDSLTEIADYVGLHYTTVSRIVRKFASSSA